MRTKEEFKAELYRRRNERVNRAMAPSEWIEGNVEVVFDLVSETLEQIVSEKAKAGQA